jgi:hypothetical protein
MPEGPSNHFEQELLRLTFCSIVIASFLAALGAGHDLKNFLSPSGTTLTITLLAVSAGFSFAYLLGVASALKYQAPRQIDRFPLSPKVTHYFYDASINVFGIYVLVLLVGWLNVHILRLPGTVWYWPVYLVLASIVYTVARLVWALAQQVIEWHYDLIKERTKS